MGILGDFLEDSQRSAREANSRLNRLNSELDKKESSQSFDNISFDDSDFFEEAAKTVEYEFKGFSIGMLQDYLSSAIMMTKEYNYSVFKDRLFEVFGNYKIIEFDRDYISHRLYVIIHAEEVAGDANEYMEAVRSVRPNYESGDQASWMWRELFYKPAREGKTLKQKSRRKGRRGRKPSTDRTAEMKRRYQSIIESRLAKIERNKAPYWYFLNYGSVSMLGDEGTPYPSLPATNFVEKAEAAIETFINTQLRLEIERLKAEAAALEQEDVTKADTAKAEEDLYRAAATFMDLKPNYAPGLVNEAKMELSKAELKKKRQQLYKKWS